MDLIQVMAMTPNMRTDFFDRNTGPLHPRIEILEGRAKFWERFKVSKNPEIWNYDWDMHCLLVLDENWIITLIKVGCKFSK